ncbi:hypothetical protein ScPMuIL_010260 [Solemya velum]
MTDPLVTSMGSTAKQDNEERGATEVARDTDNGGNKEIMDNVNRKPQFHNFSSEEWCAKWENKTALWHLEELHPVLEKHADKMIAGREGIRILVPFCGKDIGMKWLADMNHEVVGVEFSELAIKDFFADHELTYTCEDLPRNGGKLFTACDIKIRIYCCDFYQSKQYIVTRFDAVWDRGGLTAANRTDHRRYADTVVSLICEDCRYLLVVFEYDDTLYSGPPSNINETTVFDLYKDKFSIEKIDSNDAMNERRKRWGVDCVNEVVYLMH